MKLRILTLAIAALFLPSCASTLPKDTAIAGQSGKSTVAVDVSGMTWKEALKKLGLSIVEAGGQALADYAVTTIKGRLAVPASGK